ncbi:butyrophilin subfamily 1 member A1-like isoform X2 [Chelonia mydas]|uniref:butyrophilin subfamily 1 member A1-like isoform X2 n=1 Tax=Chelonia mydas TaxID=8469 RepID=UPI0018A1FA3B|nr:butyrophilin subfamily 1 member A1-like isoform X2 [Chelonia mydas]
MHFFYILPTFLSICFPDLVPHPTNADCSASKDLIQKVIFSEGFLIIIMVFTTSGTLIIICRQGNCGNRRVLDDPERAPLLEEYGQNCDENSELQDRLKKLAEENDQLKNDKKKLEKENEWRRARNETDDITLDADTAHPNLSITEEKKSLKHEAQPQKVPPNQDRFDSTVCVLGSEGFSSGEHYWEVDVRSSTDWDLGVARKSTERKGKLSLSPKKGFWTLGLNGRDYWAKTDPWTQVMVQKKPKKIGVYLSYQERLVTFFSVTDMSVLFTFNNCSFSGEVYPFFKNSHKETTMRISSIKEKD